MMKAIKTFGLSCLVTAISMFPAVSWGAEIWMVDRDWEARPTRMIGLEGRIERGDFERIKSYFGDGPVVTALYMYSLGGDITEALKIAKLVNDNLVRVVAPYRSTYDGQPSEYISDGMRPRSMSNLSCASACALIWLAARRKGGNQIYVHRPRFDHQYFASMETEEAQDRYSSMLLNIRKFLESRNVPSEVITMIESVPSSDLKKLDEHWIDLLGGEDAFLSEMTHARCKKFDGGKVAKRHLARNNYEKYKEEVSRYLQKHLPIDNHTRELFLKALAYNDEYERLNKELEPYDRCRHISWFDILHDIQY